MDLLQYGFLGMQKYIAKDVLTSLKCICHCSYYMLQAVIKNLTHGGYWSRRHRRIELTGMQSILSVDHHLIYRKIKISL